MKILHLFHDWLFVDGAINQFEKYEATSRFVCLRDEGAENKPLEHITRSDVVESVIVDTPQYDELLRAPYDYVWVHYADGLKMSFVNKLPQNGPKVIWSSWGLDYVTQLGMPVLALRTLAHFLLHQPMRQRVRYLVGRALFEMNLDRLRWRKIYRDFFSRVSYFSSVFREEHSLLLRMVPHAQPLDFHYFDPKSKTVSECPSCNYTAKRMWIGNSATYTNNHFDVFVRAKKYKDWDVVCPLVYGDIRDEVEAAGQKTFGSRWHSLTEFMPYNAYMGKMSECSVFVFGHRRQQSLGNISTALKVGGCVFLDPKNVTYQLFKNNGIVVYTLDDFEYRLEESLRDYSSKRQQNIQKLMAFRGRDVLMNEVRATIAFLAKQVIK